MKEDSRECSGATVFGVHVDALDEDRLIALALEMARRGDLSTIMYVNIHVLNAAWSDTDLRNILCATDVVYCDGFGVVLGARALGYALPERMTGADWIYPFCEQCARNETSLYLLGSAPGVSAQAAARLGELYPGLTVVGAHHGHVHDGSFDHAALIDEINEARPDILLVGMGTPLQEKWTAAHRHDLNVSLCWTVGALFDYVAGVVPRGPRWMLDNGLEWLYRLYLEPARLGRRYLIGNPLFFFRVLKQKLFGEGRDNC